MFWVLRGDKMAGQSMPGGEVHSLCWVVNAEVLKCSWKGKCMLESCLRDVGLVGTGSEVTEIRASRSSLVFPLGKQGTQQKACVKILR